ncbi:MAG: hypothetical protein Q8Q42_02980 [Nanoarchaeota archaeon]|nr:hypothetical protein [Nanoarchaeota archaeon]
MGFFGRLFHKEEDERDYVLPDLSMTDETTEGPWSSPSEAKPFESARRAEMADYSVPEISRQREPVSGISSRDIELIMSKLDLIASRLDNINRRLEYIESSRKGTNLW